MVRKALVWLRFARLKISYGWSLICVLYQFFVTKGRARDRYQMHLVIAIAKLDVLSIYATLQEFLIFPPY